jgi:hypothetical protein
MTSSTQTLPIFEHKFDHNYKCPISHEIMIEPVIAADGHNYEKENIELWFQTSGGTSSPMTNEVMRTVMVFPNTTLRTHIREWIETIKNKNIPEEISSLVDTYYETKRMNDLDRDTQEALQRMNNQLHDNYYNAAGADTAAAADSAANIAPRYFDTTETEMINNNNLLRAHLNMMDLTMDLTHVS